MKFDWLDPLYEKGLNKKEAAAIKKDLSAGHFSGNVWVVLIPFGPENLLEIYPSRAFQQSYFSGQTAEAVGIAQSRSDAKELVRQIVEQVYLETGGTDVRGYLQRRMKHRGG